MAGDVAEVVEPGMHRTLNLIPSIHKPGVVPHACNPCIWEVKTRESGVHNCTNRYMPTLLSSKFKASLRHMRPYLKQNQVGELQRIVILTADFLGVSERGKGAVLKDGE